MESLGYEVRQADVDTGSRGRWRRVLVGSYVSLDEARREAARLRQMREFGDARAVMLDEGSVGFPKTVAASR